VEKLLSEVQASVCNEYQRAAEEFGAAHNSLHESFAVILEELDEASDHTEMFQEQIKCFWVEIKQNKLSETRERLPIMHMLAEQAAAEWIQVAAMCKKAQAEPEGK